MRKYLLEFIVFICGGVVMILELDGSRIMAPYFGASLAIWTSLIGIILGSLSLGYWLGGKLADRISNYRILSLIIFLAALAVFSIVLLKIRLLEFAAGLGEIRIGALLASLVFFSPASICLGMVSPYATKIKLKDLSYSGSTVGSLYAISTIGSIIGTFFAGFFLIPTYGNAKIIVILALVLLLTSIITSLKSDVILKILTSIIFLAFLRVDSSFALPDAKIVADKDTLYNRLIVYDNIDPATNRPVRNVMTDPYGIQSSKFLDKDDGLVFQYTKYYFLAQHFNPGFKNSLLVGGGAYTFAREYLRKYPDALLDVVEIDAGYTAIAKQYFNLEYNPRMKIYEQDGRTFINKTTNKYDIIYIDAFNSALSVPSYLTTAETVKHLADMLNDHGAILLNLISAIDGDKGKFLRAEYYTYKKYFPFVYIFPTYKPERGDLPQNLVLVAVKTDIEPPLMNVDPQLDDFLKTQWKNNITADVPILTDDFCPVDQYMLAILK